VQLIKIYTALFFFSVLALQPIYAASKYIVPILGFVILFVARSLAVKYREIVSVNGCVQRKLQTTHWETDNVAYGLWQAIWDKGRTLNRPKKVNHNGNRAPSVHRQLFCVPAILLAVLLLNACFITQLAIKQVDNNVHYLKGDKYAGYDAKTRAMFEEFETIDIPKGAEVFCRKPEFLYYLRGIQSKYPWNDKETK
jgi:hypothetical protein